MHDLLFHLPDKALILLAMLMLVRMGLSKPLACVGLHHRTIAGLHPLHHAARLSGLAADCLCHHLVSDVLRVVFHLQMGSIGMLPGQTS